MAGVSVVVPTVGRPSLAAVLAALAGAATGDRELEILVVDDRPGGAQPVPAPPVPGGYRVLAAGGGGPAAARNLGWRAARHPWVAFLDDDVLPDPDWLDRLAADLAVPDQVGGVQGRVRVPLPAGRPPTDWERCTAGLARARWITADLAYRRVALVETGGFDERFRRAFREDAELAHRVRRAGWELVRGERAVTHPVRPEGPWVSLRMQRGNADDALLRRMYGPGWRTVLEVPRGRRHRHVAVSAAGVVGLLATATAAVTRARAVHRGRIPAIIATGATAGWLAGTAEFAATRIAAGPKTVRELAVMALTSILIPPLATAHWSWGWWSGRRARPIDVPS